MEKEEFNNKMRDEASGFIDLLKVMGPLLLVLILYLIFG